MKQTIQRYSAFTLTILLLAGCGTLVGLPGHGGGKRFATEQGLVSASIRSSLKDIDVTSLRGKRVAVVFDIVADEGAGSIQGGKLKILGAATAGYLMSPLSASSSAFQLFNLNDAGSNYVNSSNVGNSIANTTFINNGTNRRSESSSNISNGSNSANSTSNSNGSNTANDSTTSNSNSTDVNTSTQTSNQTGSNTQTTNNAGSSNDVSNQTGNNDTTGRNTENST